MCVEPWVPSLQHCKNQVSPINCPEGPGLRVAAALFSRLSEIINFLWQLLSSEAEEGGNALALSYFGVS